MRNATIILAVVAVVGLAVPAWGASYTWDGGGADDDWNNDANWGGLGHPVAGDNATIEGTYTVLIDEGCATVRLRLAGTATINMTGGSFDTTNETDIGDCNAKTDPVTYAYFIQSNGTFTTSYHLRIGYGSNNNQGFGIYRISGGTFSQSSGRTVQLGYKTDRTGQIGRFEVSGLTADITCGSYNQMDGSVLKITLDATSGTVALVKVTNNANLSGTLEVDLNGYAGGQKTIDVMKVGGTLDYDGWDADGYAQDALECDYTLGSRAGTGADAGKTFLTVTIPEPATLALLGLGGMGVLIRRRRK